MLVYALMLGGCRAGMVPLALELPSFVLSSVYDIIDVILAFFYLLILMFPLLTEN